MGDTMNKDTFLGPLADQAQFDRVMSFLEEGKKEGAEILTGGTRKGDKGYGILSFTKAPFILTLLSHFIEPTIFLNPAGDAKVYTDEIFGPVLSIKTFKTEEEGIALANDTTYGLSSCIYTSDVTRALRVASKIQAGSVSINQALMPSKQTPFGGMKQSGSGREVGKAGLMAYLEPKTIHIK
jgi:aldehyde dehydrogenase (NAD+)